MAAAGAIPHRCAPEAAATMSCTRACRCSWCADWLTMLRRAEDREYRSDYVGRAESESEEDAKDGPAAADLENMTEEEKVMVMMGIGGFGSTKGKSVADNQATAARGYIKRTAKHQYRQYMNRKRARGGGGGDEVGGQRAGGGGLGPRRA